MQLRHLSLYACDWAVYTCIDLLQKCFIPGRWCEVGSRAFIMGQGEFPKHGDMGLCAITMADMLQQIQPVQICHSYLSFQLDHYVKLFVQLSSNHVIVCVFLLIAWPVQWSWWFGSNGQELVEIPYKDDVQTSKGFITGCPFVCFCSTDDDRQSCCQDQVSSGLTRGSRGSGY